MRDRWTPFIVSALVTAAPFFACASTDGLTGGGGDADAARRRDAGKDTAFDAPITIPDSGQREDAAEDDAAIDDASIGDASIDAAIGDAAVDGPVEVIGDGGACVA